MTNDPDGRSVRAEGQGVLTGDQSWQTIIASPEAVALGTALAIYSKAFLEALGKRTGDGAVDLSKRMIYLVKTFVQRKGSYETEKYYLGAGGVEAARIVITADLPDEARLALLDMDVTADDLHGKLLQWDSSASAWRPADDS